MLDQANGNNQTSIFIIGAKDKLKNKISRILAQANRGFVVHHNSYRNTKGIEEKIKEFDITLLCTDQKSKYYPFVLTFLQWKLIVTKVIIISNEQDEDHVGTIIAAGANGFVLTDNIELELTPTIANVLKLW